MCVWGAGGMCMGGRVFMEGGDCILNACVCWGEGGVCMFVRGWVRLLLCACSMCV